MTLRVMTRVLPPLTSRYNQQSYYRQTPRFPRNRGVNFSKNSNFHLYTALGTDGQDVAGAFAQRGIDTRPEAIQQVKGNKCLNRTGKAAAVDTVSAPAHQVMVTQAEGNRHRLLVNVTGGNDIL